MAATAGLAPGLFDTVDVPTTAPERLPPLLAGCSSFRRTIGFERWRAIARSAPDLQWKYYEPIIKTVSDATFFRYFFHNRHYWGIYWRPCFRFFSAFIFAPTTRRRARRYESVPMKQYDSNNRIRARAGKVAISLSFSIQLYTSQCRYINGK